MVTALALFDGSIWPTADVLMCCSKWVDQEFGVRHCSHVVRERITLAIRTGSGLTQKIGGKTARPRVTWRLKYAAHMLPVASVAGLTSRNANVLPLLSRAKWPWPSAQTPGEGVT